MAGVKIQPHEIPGFGGPRERFAVRTAISEIAERLNREISVQAHLRSEWEEGRSSNRVLRRIAEGALLMLKGTI